MSKHLSEPKKKNPPRRQGKSLRGLEVLRIYPDNGADSEGYPAGWRIPVFLLSAVLLLLVSLFFGRGTPIRLVLGALSFCLSAFHIVLNLMISVGAGFSARRCRYLLQRSSASVRGSSFPPC